ncbi:MAG: zinc ribbon domain-containing protein [Pirellulales bacterium]|nr:zinc ribbon domain-containing protein [Pirellulales bacterium]
MPLYEYICRDCGKQCEILIRGSQKPICPSCQSGKLDKIISVPSAPQVSSASGCGARESGNCSSSDCGGCPCAMGD